MIKKGARVMLTTNIDIEDRLINGLIGTVRKIQFESSAMTPSKIYIAFDDPKAGMNAIHKGRDQFAKDNKVVPIKRVLIKIKINQISCTSPVIERTQFRLTLSYLIHLLYTKFRV